MALLKMENRKAVEFIVCPIFCCGFYFFSLVPVKDFEEKKKQISPFYHDLGWSKLIRQAGEWMLWEMSEMVAYKLDSKSLPLGWQMCSFLMSWCDCCVGAMYSAICVIYTCRFLRVWTTGMLVITSSTRLSENKILPRSLELKHFLGAQV